MKFNPFCMCCAVSKQEQNIRSFQDMDKKVEYMKKVMDRMANIAEEDCAPSVSVELKKCSVISGNSLWKTILLSKKIQSAYAGYGSFS